MNSVSNNEKEIFPEYVKGSTPGKTLDVLNDKILNIL